MYANCIILEVVPCSSTALGRTRAVSLNRGEGVHSRNALLTPEKKVEQEVANSTFYIYMRSLPLKSIRMLLWAMGSCHKRKKPQAPIRNRQTRKVANAKGLNRNTNLT